MVRASAPGKAMIAGEYAVLSPGQPSLVTAVDRRVSCTLTPDPGSGLLLTAPERNRELRLEWHGETLQPVDPGPETVHFFRFVRAACQETARVLETRPDGLRLSFSSHLAASDQTGQRTKLGLGSSAAISVVTCGLLLAAAGTPTRLAERAGRLACLAHRRAQGDVGSAADIFASAHGGLLEYVAPDFEALDHLQDACDAPSWPSLRLRPLTWPRDLASRFYWTRRAADTRQFIEATSRVATEEPDAYDRFLTESRDRVERLVRALETSDLPATLNQMDALARNLKGLGNRAGVPIEPDAFTRFRRAVRQTGGATKLSGAGGGDLGICWYPKGTVAPDRLDALAAEHDLVPLPLAFSPDGLRVTPEPAK